MALFFHRLEIGFINSRVKSDEWKKGTSSGFNLVPRFSLSLARSVKRVGENPGNEVAVASSIISGAGDGEGKRSLFSFFFFFQFCSYQIRPQLAGLSYKNPSLGVYLFSEKVFVSLWHNLSPRDVNDKVAIITILIIKK